MFEHLFDTGFFKGEKGKAEIVRDFMNMAKNVKFGKFDEKFTERTFASKQDQHMMKKVFELFSQKTDVESFFSNYPLIFVCPPDERDKRITISQIHTHKIRGADIILISEDDDALKKAATGKPASVNKY